MAPIKPGHFDYQFRPQTLVSVRKGLGLTQAQLADFLEVPVNTVSRWETGATTPDAKVLAAIYSIAQERGQSPQFFTRRTTMAQVQKQRTKALFAWDFQNRPTQAQYVKGEWHYMNRYLNIIQLGTHSSRRLIAFITPYQADAASALQEVGFGVQMGYFDADTQLAKDAVEYCVVKPAKTVFVLASNDGDYVPLLRDLQNAGVEVYLWADDECSDKLRRTVDSEHFIPWRRPFVVVKCLEVLASMSGKTANKGDLGNRCKEALKEVGVYPENVGFSRTHPYISIANWLDKMGAVEIKVLAKA